MAGLAGLQTMGVEQPVKENHGRSDNATNVNHGDGKRGGGFDYGRSARTTSEAASRFVGNRSNLTVDIRSVERMREAIVKADERRNFRDYLVIAGATLLAVCVVATLVLASAINARANRIIENDAVRARAGEAVVTRLEGKLDAHIATGDRIERKVDTLTTTSIVASATTLPPKRTTPTTRRTPATTRPTPPTTAVRPPTTTTAPTTTTTKPCSFALLNLCLAR